MARTKHKYRIIAPAQSMKESSTKPNRVLSVCKAMNSHSYVQPHILNLDVKAEFALSLGGQNAFPSVQSQPEENPTI